MYTFVCQINFVVYKTTSAGEDYVPVANLEGVISLSTDARPLNQITITMIINNDNMFELTESFMVSVSFPDYEAPVLRVILQTTAKVIIFDNDGKTS